MGSHWNGICSRSLSLPAYPDQTAAFGPSGQTYGISSYLGKCEGDLCLDPRMRMSLANSIRHSVARVRPRKTILSAGDESFLCAFINLRFSRGFRNICFCFSGTTCPPFHSSYPSFSAESIFRVSGSGSKTESKRLSAYLFRSWADEACWDIR